MMSDKFPLLAADYQNEAEVGDALADAFKTGLVQREDLFITTKASHSQSFYFFFLGVCFLVFVSLALD